MISLIASATSQACQGNSNRDIFGSPKQIRGNLLATLSIFRLEAITPLKDEYINRMVPAEHAYNMHHSNQLKGHTFPSKFSF